MWGRGKWSFFVIVAILFFACTSRDQELEYGTYSCNAEKTKEVSGKKYFKGKGAFFQQTETQNEEEARSKKHSIKLSKVVPYGLTLKDFNAQPGDYYKASVWRKSQDNVGLLVVTDKTGKKVYKQEKYPVTKEENGWELLQIEVFIPPHFDGKELKIFAWNPYATAAYFDDITVEKQPKKKYPLYENPLKLSIGKDQYSLLKTFRKNAYKQGHIGEDEKDKVPAILTHSNKKSAVEIRLKGDWLDHLEGKKWSFRIQSEDDIYWHRMKEFSVQNPTTRSFLNEWVLHQILLKENVLTTRYDFVPIEVNGNSLGIYAYEEHFEKQLVESQKRREGVQLKIAEDSFWQWIEMIEKKDTLHQILPMAEAAIIEPFSTNSTMDDPILRTQFLAAQNSVWRYKNTKGNLSEVLDFDAFAKYFAIADLTRAKHGFGTLNLRFYFNPVSQKIEPIAYDGYGGELKEATGKIIRGYATKCDTTTNDAKDYPSYALFNDSVFVAKYVTYLEKYSTQAYIDSLMANLEEAIENREKMLQKEYTYYKYNYGFLQKNAAQIRKELPAYKTHLEECLPTFSYQRTGNKKIDYSICEGRNANIAIALKAYLKEEKKDNYTLTLQNFHCQPIKILGYGRKSSMREPAPKGTTLKAYKAGSPIPTIEVEMDKNYNRIYYTADGSNQELVFKFLPWQLPSNATTTREELINNNKEIKYSVQQGNKVIFKGEIQSTTPIIIPAGHEVVFEKGTEMDLLESAFFMSFSPVQMLGTESQRITIKSTDGSSMGFSVLEPEQQSNLEHVVFDGLKNLDYKGWLLMGAVNFYKTTVHFENCAFINNKSEDGLNTISSIFTMKNCLFENTFGDAFDTDFCKGTITETSLVNTGNDGLDFSGSKIEVTNCRMNNIGDKAISIGEDSYAKIEGLEVNKAVFGLAVKDLSHVDFSGISLLNCKHVIAAYQKKPEFGPATLKGNGLTTSKGKEEFLIDLNSELLIGGDTIRGKAKIDVDALYN